jgi:hypothetical protein
MSEFLLAACIAAVPGVLSACVAFLAWRSSVRHRRSDDTDHAMMRKLLNGHEHDKDKP